MICPYCTEEIKDEAIVCAHCHRDLAFFKPMEERLKAIDSKLAALSDCVSEISAFLDKQQVQEVAAANVEGNVRPGFVRMFAVVFIEVVLTVTILLAFGALILSSDSTSTGLIVGLVVLFLVPIGLGFSVGITWRGRNLKRYLMVGLASGLVEIALPLVILTLIASSSTTTEVLKWMSWIIALGLGREIFGFACGGLLGDVIEKKRHPERYGKGFSEKFAASLMTGKPGRFDHVTSRLANVMTSMTPIVPLIGVVITTVGGYYASRAVADRRAQIPAEITKAAERSPTPTPSASP